MGWGPRGSEGPRRLAQGRLGEVGEEVRGGETTWERVRVTWGLGDPRDRDGVGGGGMMSGTKRGVRGAKAAWTRKREPTMGGRGADTARVRERRWVRGGKRARRRERPVRGSETARGRVRMRGGERVRGREGAREGEVGGPRSRDGTHEGECPRG